MFRPPSALVPALAAVILLDGCEGSREPAGPPTFEAKVAITAPTDARTGDLDTVVKQVRARAEHSDIPITIKPGPEASSLTLHLFAETETEARKQLDSLLQTVALDFRTVHPQSSNLLAEEVGRGDRIVPGHKIYEYHYLREDGTPAIEPLFLNKRVQSVGPHIKRAYLDPSRAGVIAVSMDSAGGKIMTSLTTPMEKGVDRLAVLLNDEVINAPVINDVLSNNFIIQGIDDPRQAADLVAALMAPIEQPLEVRSLTPLTSAAP